jgi:hypothetical protein
MLVLLKALAPRLTAISGSTRADGVKVRPYMAVRHALELEPVGEVPADALAADQAVGAPPEPVRPQQGAQVEDAAPGPFSALLAEMATLPPPADPEIAAIEDRLDLADAMAEDPHSDRTKRLLQIMAVKELDRIAEDVPAMRTLLAAELG